MAELHQNHDITCVYYTANYINPRFAKVVREQLLRATDGIPIISVSKEPINFGDNIWVGDTPRSHVQIYRQALIGAQAATTKYIALAEDDVLYSPEHFKRRSSPGKFAYNLGTWNIYTWVKPAVFSHKGAGRINLNALICERELFIEAMEERFDKYPNEEEVNTKIWAEPSKYESQLGVTVREAELFYTNPPNIVFSHESELSFAGLGTRKRLGEMRAIEIPYWGKAVDVARMYR